MHAQMSCAQFTQCSALLLRYRKGDRCDTSNTPLLAKIHGLCSFLTGAEQQEHADAGV